MFQNFWGWAEMEICQVVSVFSPGIFILEYASLLPVHQDGANYK